MNGKEKDCQYILRFKNLIFKNFIYESYQFKENNNITYNKKKNNNNIKKTCTC